MSQESQEPQQSRPEVQEKRGAAEWIAAGEGAVAVGLQAWQTFGPSGKEPPPPPPPPPEPPSVILPPGVDVD